MIVSGKFIVFESIDAALRSSFARSTAKNMGIKFIGKKELPDEKLNIATEIKKLASLMWPENDNEIGHLLPLEYWINVQACWYTLRSKFIIEQQLQTEGSIICDSWYYNFIAKCKVDKKFNKDDIDFYFKHIKKPDLSVLITVNNFEKLWENQTDLRPSKMGVHQGFKGLDKNVFIEFQASIQNNLIECAKENHWLILSENELKENFNKKIIERI